MCITNSKDYADQLPSFMPVKILWAYLQAFFYISASLSIISKKYVRRTCYLLGVYNILLIVIWLINSILTITDPQLINTSIYSLIIATGITAAIFYIGSEAAD
jgi:hydrogenase-4 membrane subunit HyfE